MKEYTFTVTHGTVSVLVTVPARRTVPRRGMADGVSVSMVTWSGVLRAAVRVARRDAAADLAEAVTDAEAAGDLAAGVSSVPSSARAVEGASTRVAAATRAAHSDRRSMARL
jgi:hypothetical protein